ncbi:probable protein phosphatase 2C 33 [Syzygium oleosum]|uniref:probable protein phosphatase 2C 33 n=1 Tax=Syzygium oleosum TaxID=219896 RepID=UPI0011D2B45E|nr:probable protein phosphatase 2C 33 [Syzygium oleosum]
MFLNGSSEVASLFTVQGKKGTNQDAMIVWENFGSRTDTIFCGVFDGHGPYGHLVAKRVRDSLPLKVRAHWRVNLNSEDVREISIITTESMSPGETALVSAGEETRTSAELEETEKQVEIFQTLKESFLKAFKVMDRELRMQRKIDCFCSGTTAVTLVKRGHYVVIGNVGDSRAVLGTRDKDGSLIAVQLTVDLKPSIPAEAERIRKCRGRVFALQDEPEVARVWLPNNNSPGLAMARAFGDFCLKNFGLISVPDLSCLCLSEKDEFIVLASDGIWDVLSNKEVVEIIASAPARSSASRALVEYAVRAWRHKYPSSKVDDCAAVCLFLDMSNSSAASSTKSHNQLASVDDQSEMFSEKDLLISRPIQNDSEITTEESNEDAAKLEEMQSESETDWSALEGVSRVNTLVNLPRFVPGREDKRKDAGEKSHM